MAATDGRARRRGLGGLRVVRELPWVAAGIGALAARDAFGQSTVDARFLFFKESGGRTEVLNPLVLVHEDFGAKNGQLDLMLGYDSISGASPSGGYPTADVTTSASGKLTSSGSVPQVEYQDTRKSGSLTYGRKFGAHLPTVDVSFAKENDYTARGFGISDSWTMAQGRGTLHVGASFSRDVVTPVTNDLSLSKSTDGYSLGWTWILSEKDLIDVSASLMKLSGYLDDPYKIVPVGPSANLTSSPDHRPDTRSRRALVAKYGHYFSWDGALKLNYRYYDDDWSIHAHTLDVVYDQKLDSDWIVTPRVRLYTQTGASFYGSRFVAPQPYMSADYRLSPLASVLGGLTLARRIDDALGVSLGATLQSQHGRDRVTPISTSPGNARGAPTVSAADLNVTTITAGLTYRY